jgi:hypothetical protein
MSEPIVITPADSIVYAKLFGATVILDTIMAMTISTDADVKPVWNLGSKSPDGYTFGPSIIAGTIIFPKTMSMPFEELLMYSYKFPYVQKMSDLTFDEFVNDPVELKPEYSPPFSIVILSSPEIMETPAINYKYISGVKIVNVDEQMDQQSMTSIIIYKYTASNVANKHVSYDGKEMILDEPMSIKYRSSYFNELYGSILVGES